MNHLIIPTLFILFFLVACTSQDLPKIGYKENSCIKELNEKYRNIASLGNNIYRLEKIEQKGLIVSIWHHNEWYYQGHKKHTYFHDSSGFSYEPTNCPDNKGVDADLSSRLRQVKTK